MDYGAQEREMSTKLIIFHTDGTKEEVEPVKNWTPPRMCRWFEPNKDSCPKEATQEYEIAEGVKIPLCNTHYPLYKGLVELGR